MFVSFTSWSWLSWSLICRPSPPLASGTALLLRAWHTPPKVGLSTENAGCGLTQGAVRPGSGCGARSNAPAQDALLPGLGNPTEKPGGAWRKTQSAQGVVPGLLLLPRRDGEHRKQRGPAPGARRTASRAGQRYGESRLGSWRRAHVSRGFSSGGLAGGYQGNAARPGGCVTSDRARGNRDAESSVRPTAVAEGLPEHVEAAAPLLMFNGCAAGVEKRPELVGVSDRRM